jgi:cytochrome c
MNSFSRVNVFLPALVLGVAACSPAEKSAQTSSTSAEPATPAQSVATTAQQATAAVAEAATNLIGDPKRGKIVFLQCRACHALEASEGHRVGPNLSGVLGATVGTKEGFNYSTALSEADAVWTEASLQAFLTKPSDYYPGTIMAFAGIPKAEDRAAVVAYIKERTAQ